MRDRDPQVAEVDGEVIAEEDAEPGSGQESPVTVLAEREFGGVPVLREEMRTAAIAVAGGALAGAATVAAVRAVGSAGRGSGRSPRRLGRRARRQEVVASRSFLVDVHLLGR
ncbi:MAG TPA: hypothetical protein VFD37_00470 [Solirubrobacterales bacterium]|nr:hypothetical protein [Solirubrobacterales bacterium]